MNIVMNLPDFDGNAIDVIWEKGSNLVLKIFEDQICIQANREGLLSLAKQMIYLSVNEVSRGSHVHYDSYFLGDSQFELVLERIN